MPSPFISTSGVQLTMSVVNLRAFLVTVILMSIICLTTAENEYVLTIDNFSCNSTDPENFIKTLNCTLVPTENGDFDTFYFAYEYTKELHAFKINLGVALLRRKKLITVFNFTDLDGCEMLQSKNVPLIGNNAEAWFGSGKIPQRCPVKRGEFYYMHGFVPHKNFALLGLRDPIVFYIDFIVHNNKIVQAVGQSRIKRRKRSG